ncbi:MAG: hypothetical protein ACRCYQ_16505 [Nocardioides sp.]
MATESASPADVRKPTTPREQASIGRVLRDQRKIIGVAAVLIVSSLWILVGLGLPVLGGCLAIGVGLGLLNHLVTEYWLLTVISAGAAPSRNQMAGSTFVRLAVLTIVALGVAVAFWPYGIGTLLGLALFRLIALVMTTIPLLKELRNP